MVQAQAKATEAMGHRDFVLDLARWACVADPQWRALLILTLFDGFEDGAAGERLVHVIFGRPRVHVT